MLNRLVSQFRQLEDQIAFAISSDDEQSVYRLDQNLEKTRKQIASLRPGNPEQRKQQIEFLFSLVLNGSEQLQETEVFRDVQQLIADYLDAPETPYVADREQLLSERVDRVSSNPLELASFLDGECSSDLFTSNLRISIIGLDSHYQRTSCGNALFYSRKPDEIANRHVGELIGAERFKGRAQSHLEQCYQGNSLQYYHLLDHGGEPAGSAIMRCEMIPHRPSGNEVRGAVVIMRDVTMECMRPGQIELTGLN